MILLALVCALQRLPGQELATSWLVIGDVSRTGRSVLMTDVIEESRIRGGFVAPSAGLEVRVAKDTTRSWSEAELVDGKLGVPARGYAFGRVEAKDDGFAILRIVGAARVYIDGEPRIGDLYRRGETVLPFRYRKGGTELLIKAGRGKVEVALSPAERSAFFTQKDTTLGDIVLGEQGPWHGAVVIALLHDGPLFRGEPLSIRVHDRERRFDATEVAVPPFVTPGVRKVRFDLVPVVDLAPGMYEIEVQLLQRHPRGPSVLDRMKLSVRVAAPTDLHKRSFVSDIDGSVQYYAVQPSLALDRGAGATPAQALFLSLHGASVEAHGQAAAYARKTWGHVVCPTNRRPFGFDWEFLGRLDALEVLADAKARYAIDERAVYVTGHSMGGHGTWQIAVTQPDLFAAIGPSAGWCSFATYGGGRRAESAGAPDEVRSLLQRAASPSDTLLRKHNYAGLGVYILHGDADRTVPVREAREMRLALADFHRDVAWHEQGGADHWWDDSDEAGAACVDWPPMFDFFARHRRPSGHDLRELDFATVNPSDASRHHWLEILSQEQPLAPSRARIRLDPHARRFVGTTENVRSLALEVPPGTAEHAFELRLDLGTEGEGAPLRMKADESGRIVLTKLLGAWQPGTLATDGKHPQRGGPFQHVFRHRVVFVYGTKGSEDERAWSQAKARFDAEELWYRGNGSVDVVSDDDFLAQANEARFAQRNVVVYGNSKNNAAWAALLGEAVTVDRDRITLAGAEDLPGVDLALLVVRPRPGTQHNLVAGIGGTGLVGMRLTEVFPYFVSGVHYPDYFVARPDMLSPDPDIARRGIVLAGFYDNDWRFSEALAAR